MNFKMSSPLLLHANDVLATVEYITMPLLRMLALVYHIQQIQKNHGIVVVTIYVCRCRKKLVVLTTRVLT